MTTKIRPNTTIYEDGFHNFYKIFYLCPVCNEYIDGYKRQDSCDICGTLFDWGTKEPRIKVTREVEW